MVFIVKKKINGGEYYYARKSVRENGKIRAVTVGYLGKDKEEAEKKLIELKDKPEEKEKINKLKNKEDYMVKEEKTEKKEIDGGVKLKDEGREKEFISFIQEQGLVWGPEPEIYGGLSGFYTYGPIGKLLKNKVENSVRAVFNSNGFRELEGPTIMPDVVWKASGHLGTFSDPVIKTMDGKENYRVDKLLEENGIEVKAQDRENLL